MGIKFSVKASDINAAIDVAKIVEPRPIDKQGQAGYLLVIRGEMGYIYSRDAQHVARAQFPVTDVEGEGPFVYPAEHIKSLSSFGDNVLSFEVSTEDDNYSVKYSAMDGKAWEQRPTFDPRILQTCDRDLTEAEGERVFPVMVLREALSQSRHFTETKDTNGSDKERPICIFDKNAEIPDPKNPDQKIRPGEKGDGSLFASNGKQAFYFYSDAFLSRHLMVHPAHVSALQAFLTKASGDVTVKTGRNMTFAVDATGNVFGWTHSNTTAGAQKYVYYALSNDTHVLALSRTAILSSLKHVQKILDKDRFKVKLTYDAQGKELQFHVAEGQGKGQSWPIPVTPDAASQEAASFAVSANVHHLIDLFDGCKTDQVTLRVKFIPANEKSPKDQAMFRTIDEFVLDANGKVVGGSGATPPAGTFPCKVTRFTPSMI